MLSSVGMRIRGGIFIKRFVTLMLTGVVTGLANGLFGAGGGTIIVPALERFLDFETHKAHATAIAVILPLSVLSMFIYLRGGKVGLGIVFWVSLGGVIGGYIGARLLTKIKSSLLHKIFGFFMIIAAIRMIL